MGVKGTTGGRSLRSEASRNGRGSWRSELLTPLRSQSGRGDGECSYPHSPSVQGDTWAGAPKEGAIFEAQSTVQSSGTLAHLPERKCSGLHIVSQGRLCCSLLHLHTGRTTTRATRDAANEPHHPPFFVSRSLLNVGQGMFNFSWRKT